MPTSNSDKLFRVAYFWNESMLDERMLDEPALIKLGSDEMFPLPDRVVGGSTLPIFAPRGDGMELIVTEAVSGWVWREGEKWNLDVLGDRVPIAHGDFGVVSVGTIALFFQWVRRPPEMPKRRRFPWALLTSLIFAATLVGSAGALAWAERGPERDAYHLDREWVARFAGHLPRQAREPVALAPSYSNTRAPERVALSRDADEVLANVLHDRAIANGLVIAEEDAVDAFLASTPPLTPPLPAEPTLATTTTDTSTPPIATMTTATMTTMATATMTAMATATMTTTATPMTRRTTRENELDEEDRAYERSRTMEPAGMTLSRDAIARIVRTHRSAVRYCYEAERERTPHLRGRVLVTWRIMPNGSASSARVASSSLNSRRAESCIVRQVRRWRFPRPTSATQASHTFDFQPPR